MWHWTLVHISGFILNSHHTHYTFGLVTRMVIEHRRWDMRHIQELLLKWGVLTNLRGCYAWIIKGVLINWFNALEFVLFLVFIFIINWFTLTSQSWEPKMRLRASWIFIFENVLDFTSTCCGMKTAFTTNGSLVYATFLLPLPPIQSGQEIWFEQALRNSCELLRQRK